MSERRDLFEAIRGGEPAKVRGLLAAEPGLLGARSPEGAGVVQWALYCGQATIAEELCAAGAEIDFPTAVAMGEQAAVAAGLAADPGLADRRSGDGFPPLCLAAFFGQVAVLRLLLAAGAEVEAVAANPMLVRPLHSAAAHRAAPARQAMVSALLAAGADPNAVQHGGFTPLMQAASQGDAALVEVLLAAGADRRATSDGGQTAAELAAARGHAALAVELTVAPSP
jgi:ankyrin repeat protein